MMVTSKQQINPLEDQTDMATKKKAGTEAVETVAPDSLEAQIAVLQNQIVPRKWKELIPNYADFVPPEKRLIDVFNLREITPEKIENLKPSLLRFGNGKTVTFLTPWIILTNDVILDGNTRWFTADSLEKDESGKYIVPEYVNTISLTPEQAKNEELILALILTLGTSQETLSPLEQASGIIQLYDKRYSRYVSPVEEGGLGLTENKAGTKAIRELSKEYGKSEASIRQFRRFFTEVSPYLRAKTSEGLISGIFQAIEIHSSVEALSQQDPAITEEVFFERAFALATARGSATVAETDIDSLKGQIQKEIKEAALRAEVAAKSPEVATLLDQGAIASVKDALELVKVSEETKVPVADLIETAQSSISEALPEGEKPVINRTDVSRAAKRVKADKENALLQDRSSMLLQIETFIEFIATTQATDLDDDQYVQQLYKGTKRCYEVIVAATKAQQKRQKAAEATEEEETPVETEEAA